MSSIINATTTAGVTVTGDNSGSLQLATNNGTTAVTIDTSQNVGVGITNPNSFGKLVVKTSSTSEAAGLAVMSSTNDSILTIYNSGSVHNIGATYSSTGSYQPIAFVTSGTERMRLDTSGNLLFNSGYGSVATAYGCRAWVNFNGTGTPAIRGSGNVSSITDNGTGNYSVNFATAMPDFNYAVGGLVQPSVSNNGSDTFANLGSSSANAVTIIHYEDGTLRDSSWVSCIVLR